MALQARCSNDAMCQTVTNSAKTTLEELWFRNKHTFSFEHLSARTQKACDDLENCGRQAHNGDIVDSLWLQIQDPNLQTCLVSLKAKQI